MLITLVQKRKAIEIAERNNVKFSNISSSSGRINSFNYYINYQFNNKLLIKLIKELNSTQSKFL